MHARRVLYSLLGSDAEGRGREMCRGYVTAGPLLLSLQFSVSERARKSGRQPLNRHWGIRRGRGAVTELQRPFHVSGHSPHLLQ